MTDAKNPAAPKAASVGNDTLAFRSEYDAGFRIPKKIKEGLAKLGRGWLHEAQFLKLCGLQPSQLKDYREDFRDFIVREPQNDRDKRVWAGTVAYATELKEFHNG
jgi:hypothetical protein